MRIRTQNAENLNPGQIAEFLQLSGDAGFAGESRAGQYAWTERVLVGLRAGQTVVVDRGISGQRLLADLEKFHAEARRFTSSLTRGSARRARGWMAVTCPGRRCAKR